jgi:hypothetical protein
MRRRDFIKIISGSAAAWPLAASAQQPTPVIGYLHSGSPLPNAHLVAAFRQGLSESGSGLCNRTSRSKQASGMATLFETMTSCPNSGPLQ